MKGLTRYHWLIRQPIQAFCGVNKEVNSESSRVAIQPMINISQWDVLATGE